ncbi:MAG: hypothetical protein ABEH58_07235 [Haloplanus sp.]
MDVWAVALAGTNPLSGVESLGRWLWGFRTARVVAALLVVALGVVLSKFLVRLLGRPVARRFRRPLLLGRRLD